MSGAFYQDMANIAHGIIDEFQQGALVLEQQTRTVSIPWDPGDTPTINTTSVIGTVTPIDRRLVDGTTVLATDRQVIIPALSLPAGIIPHVSERLFIDGEPTVIKRATRVPEAGVIIVYKLVVGS